MVIASFWPVVSEAVPVEPRGRLKMRLVPIGNHVIIKRSESEETTSGGIVLPDSAHAKSQTGRVLAVGDGNILKNGVRVPHQISEGDMVLFPRYAGTTIRLGDEEVLILKESEILAMM